MIRVRRARLTRAQYQALDRRQRSLAGCLPGDPLIQRAWRAFLGTPVHGGLMGVIDRQSACKGAYCEYGPNETIDHFYPKSGYPDGTFVWTNWAGACWGCNGAKGSVLHMRSGTRTPLLLDPMRENVADFLFIDPLDGEIQPASGLSSVARRRAAHTIIRLKLNRIHLKQHRKGAMDRLELALKLFYAYPNGLTEGTVLAELDSTLPMRAAARQIMRSQDPCYRPLVDFCVNQSLLVRGQLQNLGWIP